VTSPDQPGEDPREVARRALQSLHDRSVCGHCRTDYETMMQALERDGEFEILMREYVAADHRHPMAAELPERARSITAARDEVLHRLGREPAEPVPPASPARAEQGGGLVRFRPGDARGVVRSWRDGLGTVIPRPFEFLCPRERRRT